MATDLMLGAYAMAPAEPAAEEAFYSGVADLDIGGLELPLPLEGTCALDPKWLARNVRPSWDLLLTSIPTVMGRLASDHGYGLASADDSARSRALCDVARARDLALQLADAAGRRRVVAIEVHSAPGPGGGTREALTRSLEQILTWDLAGAELLVEHCDARLVGQNAAKGFSSLADEVAAILAAGSGKAGLGLSINWGRSAIEGRNSRTAVAHVKAAAAAGLLRTVVLSGASAVDSPWGPAWADAHIPPRGDDAALEASSSSLLGLDEIVATLRVAGRIPWLAVKVSVRPKDASVATRLAVAQAALTQVDDARSLIAAGAGSSSGNPSQATGANGAWPTNRQRDEQVWPNIGQTC